MQKNLAIPRDPKYATYFFPQFCIRKLKTENNVKEYRSRSVVVLTPSYALDSDHAEC